MHTERRLRKSPWLETRKVNFVYFELVKLFLLYTLCLFCHISVTCGHTVSFFSLCSVLWSSTDLDHRCSVILS